jgi:hypothetical protein
VHRPELLLGAGGLGGLGGELRLIVNGDQREMADYQANILRVSVFQTL